MNAKKLSYQNIKTTSRQINIDLLQDEKTASTFKKPPQDK